MPKEITDELARLNYKCVKAGKCSDIDNETAYHPDTLFYALWNDSILYVNGLNISHLSDINRTYLISKEKITAAYPNDCRLNCLRTAKALICGKNAMPEITADAKEAGLEIHIVRQSYVKCSTAQLNAEAFITSDTGIARVLKTLAYDVLLVTNEGISLNGYANGFIGGCLMESNGQYAAFSGRIEAHRDYEAMKSFSANHGIKLYSLSKKPLYDYGGTLLL